MTRIIHLALCFAVILTATAAGQPPAPKVTIEEIKEAWKKRQEAFAKVSLSWKTTTFRPKGSVSERLSRAERVDSGYGADEVVPPKDTTTEHVRYLKLDGDKAAYRDQSHRQNFGRGDFRDYWEEHGFDGTTYREKKSIFRPGKDHIQGEISDKPFFDIANDTDLRLLTAYLRPLMPAYKPVPINGMRLTGRESTVDSHRCIEVESPQQKAVYFLDPNLGFAIRRIVRGGGTNLSTRFEMRFAEDVSPPLPAEWSYVQYGNDGKFRYSSKSVIAAERAKETEFTVKFDPKTRLFDDKKNKEYVVLADGTLRDITGRTDASTLDELMTPSPGSRAASIIMMFVSLGLVFANIVFGILVLRKCIIRRAPQPGRSTL